MFVASSLSFISRNRIATQPPELALASKMSFDGKTRVRSNVLILT